MAHVVISLYSTKSSWRKEKAINFRESSSIPKFGGETFPSLSILVTFWWWKGEVVVIIRSAFVKVTIVLLMMVIYGIDKRFLARLGTCKILQIIKVWLYEVCMSIDP
jgi:hypothetical protein